MILVTTILIIFIYSCFYKKNISCLIISNNEIEYDMALQKYLLTRYKNVNINNFFRNKKVEGIISDINDNRTIWVSNIEYYLKKQLRESDYIIIDVTEEFNNNYNPYDMQYNYQSFENFYQKIQKLMIEVKKYTINKIIFIGLFNSSDYYDSNTDAFFYHINLKLNSLMNDNGFVYINTYELVKGNHTLERNSFNKKLAEII